MRPAIREPENKPMGPATAERLDDLFAGLDSNDHAGQILRLAGEPQIADLADFGTFVSDR